MPGAKYFSAGTLAVTAEQETVVTVKAPSTSKSNAHPETVFNLESEEAELYTVLPSLSSIFNQSYELCNCFCWRYYKWWYEDH